MEKKNEEQEEDKDPPQQKIFKHHISLFILSRLLIHLFSTVQISNHLQLIYSRMNSQSEHKDLLKEEQSLKCFALQTGSYIMIRKL